MNVTVKKTTIATNTTSWESSLVDDNGVHFATISGKVDSTRPFGAVTLTVHNQPAFEANKTVAKAAYEAFERYFDEYVESIAPLNMINTEEVVSV